MTDHLPDTPLSDEEYAALDDLLRAPELGGRSMDVSMLEGLLTALAIGPNPIMADRWLPLVWDKEYDEQENGQEAGQEAGEAGAGLAGLDAAQQAVGLVMRHYHHMVEWMSKDPGSFEPIYECGPEWSASQWCEGFLLGTQLDPTWTALFVSQPSLFAPFMRLGNPDGQQITEQDGSAARWMAEVTPSVIRIDAFWKAQSKRVQAGGAAFPQQPVLREIPKVGRNDPCHCGSGKKHKKCCA